MSFRVNSSTLAASLNNHVATPELRLAIALIFDSIESAPQDETSALWLSKCSPKALSVLSASGFEIFAQRLEDVVEDVLEAVDVPQLQDWVPPGAKVCICGRYYFQVLYRGHLRWRQTCGRERCVGEYRSRRQREGHSAWKEKNYVDRVCPICSGSFRVRPREGNSASKHYRKTCGNEDCRRELISRTKIRRNAGIELGSPGQSPSTRGTESGY